MEHAHSRPVENSPDPPEPAIIHYHQEVDRHGLIRTTGAPSIDGRIGVVNNAIREVWTQAAPKSTYREWLARSESDQIESDDLQRNLVVLVDALEPATVLQVGANGGVGRDFPIGQYMGIDSSEDALRSAAESGTKADLVLSLDQLTQPMDAATHRDLVRLLWLSTRRALVVRGREDLGGILDPAIQFHEPLSVTLQHVAPDAEIYPLDVEGDVATFVILRSPEDKHPRDFVPATLAPVVLRHPDPLSLITLRLHARHTTRFYPDHAPRLWEYPVVARLIAEHLPPGSRLVDVGAGVTPLAPFLTSRGYLVDTVDPSPTIRTWPPQPEWNEWDFLDYGAAGLAHRSWNCTLDEVPSRPPYDGVYSVSVIEHVPSRKRRALLSDISDRTRLNGLVVLTIDLVRGRDDLWNRNLGVQVEDPAAHGTFQDVVDECAAVGLELFRDEVVRGWGDVDVDIGLLALRQKREPSSRRWRDARRTLRTTMRRLRA